ncbi:helix-turn-helix transcriptional regulator [Falsirhodobacter halotolerans]|uniref:helix-turn-helix transcriptional regulator n=1 Tax=Falsirhodobacter halotolerans TaxID=1146892 RepID=UPI001FD5E0BA|nr:PAS and helix-turn-helix domain-containing protein [Falsirhodobacter halotolerans]MCJ8138287.1 PAS and helix-turn-helix domain-containing protein [Falsirhodobacter halotolerans]
MTAAFPFTLSDMPVPMVFATHRIIRDCNAEFARLFGYDRADLINGSLARLYPAIADFVRTGEMWRHNLPGGAVYYDERVMADAGGTRFWCRVHGRTRDPVDPFAWALYCFEPISRPVSRKTLSLTGRQRQILTLVAQGKTSAVIAEETGLSRRTVEAHRLRLTRAVGVENSAQLIAWFLSE